MASKVIGFRVPEDIALELERVSEERGVKVGEFLRVLVDDTLYPPVTSKVEEENNTAVNEKLESLSNTYQDLTDKVQELSHLVNRIGEKIAGYELKGILSPKTAEKIREIETNKSNIDSLKNEVDTIIISLEAADKNIGNFSEFVLSSERLFDHLQQETKALRSQLENRASSPTKVSHLEEEVSRLEKTTTRLNREVKRQPTDEIHTLTYKDGSEHKFRVYKGKSGLVKPYRVALDPFFGDKYVDLTEPLN